MSIHAPPDDETWTQKAAYDDALSLTGEEWRWQILRRNPSYQEDYRKAFPRLKGLNNTASGVTARALVEVDKAAGPWGLYSFRQPLRGCPKSAALLAATSRSIRVAGVCSAAESG